MGVPETLTSKVITQSQDYRYVKDEYKLVVAIYRTRLSWSKR